MCPGCVRCTGRDDGEMPYNLCNGKQTVPSGLFRKENAVRYFKIPKGTRVVFVNHEESILAESKEVEEESLLGFLVRAIANEKYRGDRFRDAEKYLEILRKEALDANLAACTIRDIYRNGGSYEPTQKYCDDCAQLLPHYDSCPAEGTGD